MNRRMQQAVLCASLAAVAACNGDSPSGPAVTVSPTPPRVVSLQVAGPGNLFQRGQTSQLRAMALLSNGFTLDRTGTATWQSNDTGVATVSPSGVVTAGNEGDATISANTDGQTSQMTVRVKYGIRTPDPAPGTRIPKPDESAYVAQLIRSRPDLVARSCQDQGGTWELMDFIVDSLRANRDLRWGYNGRRGVIDFPARDEIAYHWGPGPDELSRDTYAFDVIGGHCGPSPVPVWFDLSNEGTVWLSRGRF